MNTLQHGKVPVTQHLLTIAPTGRDGHGRATYSRRDVSDFLFQVEQAFETITGHKPESDDSYFVTVDEEGMSVVLATDSKGRQVRL